MIFFIIFLRAIAACLITNAHYTGIYPTDIIANGGLLGDVLFFAISGYCLFYTQKNFFSWYFKRIWRIYPAVLIITLIYFLLGQYTTETNNLLWWFIYPTNYHFVASIIILYIFYYFIARYDFLKKNIIWIMIGVAFIYLNIYIFAYDKTYYHIDTVREPMIRFLFFESMLLGGWFRYNDKRERNNFKWSSLIFTLVFMIMYFSSKYLFSKKIELSSFQIINQLILFMLLFFIFKLCSGLDIKLEKMPCWIKKPIIFISQHTLEIYLVQYVIIDVLRPIKRFPLNWISITITIIISAVILKLFTEIIYYSTEKIIFLLSNKIHKKQNQL